MSDYNEIFDRSAVAARSAALLDNERVAVLLCRVAERIEGSAERILAANAADVARLDATSPMRDRLLLTADRIAAIAAQMRSVAALPSPVGEMVERWTRPNGMSISKVRVPFGVIGVIYEARPNVTFDVFALCLRSGNACILKCGHDAAASSGTAVEIIREVLREEGVDENIVTLLPQEREATAALLTARGRVDLIIPRGGRALIDYVRENARVPIIETGAGICHTYFDRSGDTQMGCRIVTNAKTRRVSVCNALDSLVIHAERLSDVGEVCRGCAAKNVVIYADERAYAALQGDYPSELLQHADATSFGTEFLDYKMAVKTVDSLDEAITHISRYTSHHSECIVTDDRAAADLFRRSIDAACLYWNASTAFTDGGEFGFGAEIGISTQKLHARGPMALREITTYKYLIDGTGQTR